MFFHNHEPLAAIADRILETTWAAFPTLARNQLAMTWLVYDPPAPMNTGGAISAETFWTYAPRGFSYRGIECIYPASIAKLFYLVAMQEWLERAMVQPSAELERAMRDMIVDSSNDATSLVVDVLTGTTSGPELSPGPFETWKHQRNLINRYFETFGWPELQSINVNQKTWCDGPYGRERVFVGDQRENANRLTTIATARLLHSIIGGVAVSRARSQAMMDLLQRSIQPEDLAADPENQVTGFLGAGLPLEAKLWSKAGLTSWVRHDAAYVELPDAMPYLLVVFTEGRDHAPNESILPFVSHHIAAAMRQLSRPE